MTFWEHLEELRGTILRALAATMVVAVAAFVCKDWLFAVVMAPSRPDFITYRLMDGALSSFSSPEATATHGSPTPSEPTDLPVSTFHVDLFNPDLAAQFVIHMRMALWAGLLVISPYILYLLFRFVSPGLYAHERRYAVRAVLGGYVMFLMGVALNYFVIFPFAFRFLGTYQVDPSVPNQISLSSYVGMLLTLSLVMGVLFELPVLSWLLGKVGLLKSQWMKHYRKHAVVVILILAAVITPTGDAFTLALVALPIYLLYEFSILLVRRTEKMES